MFSRIDLSGEYNWAVKASNILFEGRPSRRIFDRFNGFQVLFIINSLADLTGSFSAQDIARVEDQIRTQLSPQTHNELSVFNWLRALEYNPAETLK